MSKIFYWSDWDGEYKLYFQLLLGISTAIAVTYIVLLIRGADNAIDWLIETSLSAGDLPIAGYQTRSGLLDLTSQLFLVEQKFVGSEQSLIPLHSYSYLGIFILGLMICLSIATYLSKFWYTISIGIFMVLIIGLRLEVLGIFGISHQGITIGIFMLYALTSYYFHSIREAIELKWRFLTFIGLTLIAALCIQFFASVPVPFLYLASYSFTPAIILSIIFIFLVGHEVIYGILRITTDSRAGLSTGNTKHFVILSLVYLIYVALTHLHNTAVMEWDIVYINAFALLLISSIIGLWGIKSREILYGSILPFYPYTAYLFMGLFISSFAFIGFQLQQQNDVALEVIEDAVIFGHLGFGALFFIYIIVNFINYLIQNLPVHRIAYKEDNFPYFTARLAGIIVVAALYGVSNQAAYDQAIAAFYNGMADLYRQTGNSAAAEAMYHESYVHVKIGHKANYNRGFMLEEAEQRIDAFRKAVEKNPSEYAFVNLGMAYEKENQFFEALFAYQDGLELFPSSEAIRNNMALLYNQTDVLDSTLYYLSDLSAGGFKREIIQSNLLSVCADNRLDFELFVPREEMEGNPRLDIAANLSANLALSPNDSINSPYIQPQSDRLNLISYAYLNNLVLNNYARPGAPVIALLDRYISMPENKDFAERLQFLKALSLYANGKISQAFRLLDNISHKSSSTAYYRTLLGIWALEQGTPPLAIDRLDLVPEISTTLSSYYLILAYELNGQHELAANTIAKRQAIGDSVMLDEAKTYQLRNLSVAKRQAKLSERMLAKAGRQTGAEQEELFETLAIDNPFYLRGIKSAVDFFNHSENGKTKAYDILLNAIEINPYSELLLKMYIDQCFVLNLHHYAEAGLERLSSVLTREEFNAYERIFDERKQKTLLEDREWE